jgi:hypothetical protein
LGYLHEQKQTAAEDLKKTLFRKESLRKGEKKDASFNTLFAVADSLGGCFTVFAVNFKGTLLCPDWSSDCRHLLPRSNGETRVKSGRYGRHNRGRSFGAWSFSFLN